MTVKQNLTNEMGSSSVRIVFTILYREPSTKYGNTTDVHNQNMLNTKESCLFHNHCHEYPSHFIYLAPTTNNMQNKPKPKETWELLTSMKFI